MTNQPRKGGDRHENQGWDPKEYGLLLSLLSTLGEAKKKISALSSYQRGEGGRQRPPRGNAVLGRGSWAEGSVPLVNLIAVDSVHSVTGLSWDEAKFLLSGLGVQCEDSDIGE